MKTVSLKLPDELHAKLTELSRKRSKAKSEVIRAALEAYFASGANAAEPSCADLARDLIGSVEGPADLATHPKHLRGYGR
jgi:Arc/MetJ-type ribon-helix-helix transcriptional regulator